MDSSNSKGFEDVYEPCCEQNKMRGVNLTSEQYCRLNMVEWKNTATCLYTIFIIKDHSNEVFVYQTCGHKKLCSMQVVFLFLVFLNLFWNILHLISKKNACKKRKQKIKSANNDCVVYHELKKNTLAR